MNRIFSSFLFLEYHKATNFLTSLLNREMISWLDRGFLDHVFSSQPNRSYFLVFQLPVLQIRGQGVSFFPLWEVVTRSFHLEACNVFSLPLEFENCS